MIISVGAAYFTGCPMDGCQSTLNGFVDLDINGFDKEIQWRRTDLITNSSRGCVSNEQSSVICGVDIGYVSINTTNGQILWSVKLNIEQKTIASSLPVINYQGYSIIANGTKCTAIDPHGEILGAFNYNPPLISPLAGPFVTYDGQIIVADLVSFVVIEDSGVPLGVQALNPGFVRVSRSMSLNRFKTRWYLIAQHNVTLSQAIIAAETTGSIVERLRLVWIYEYGIQLNSCGGMEGPILSTDQQWLFIVNNTDILILADNEDSASIEYLVNVPGLCASDMAFSEIDSTLIIIDKHMYNIIVLNVSTQNISYIFLANICHEEIIGQLSRITLVQNSRMILLVVTAALKAVLLLIDYNHQSLLARIDLGDVPRINASEPLSQLAYTQINEQQSSVIIAHRAIGLIAVRFVSNQSHTIISYD